MKIVFRYFIVILITVSLGSCNCRNDDVDCPGFDSNYNSWLPYSEGDTIKYINDFGNEINFIVDFVYKSTNVSHPCDGSYLSGCECPECRSPVGNAYAITNDSSRIITNQGQTVKFISSEIKIIIHDYKSSSSTLIYSIFDSDNQFKIGPTLQVDSDDSFMPSFTIDSVNYNDVIIHRVDTTIATNAFVWKTYYTKDYGIIAFHDRKTHSLFYRKP